MGTVWLAERADGQFEQRSRSSSSSEGWTLTKSWLVFSASDRSSRGSNIPGIARLLDGGVSEDDRPYFVMEYVAGEPITEHCDRRRLPIEARLRLFVERAGRFSTRTGTWSSTGTSEARERVGDRGGRGQAPRLRDRDADG